jgi:high-affinity Fe2+/Pb2+ permease
MIKLPWKIQMILGVLYIAGAISIFVYSLGVRQNGENYSHLWILTLLLIWAGSDMILRSVRKRIEEKKVDQDQ